MAKSTLTNHLHKMPYDKAVSAVAILNDAPEATEEQKAEYQAALDSHDGNPKNAKDGNTGGNKPTNSNNDDAPKKPSKAERRQAILRRWKAGEIDDATQEKEMALLDGDVDLSTIFNLEAIAGYPTRSLGDKGNTGWFFTGPVELPDGRVAKVSCNIILKK